MTTFLNNIPSIIPSYIISTTIKTNSQIRSNITTITIGTYIQDNILSIKEPLIEFNSKDFLLNLFKSNNKTNNISNNMQVTKDEFIKCIKSEIFNGDLDIYLSNVIIGEKKDLVLKDEDGTIYQFTSSDNQNNNEYNNISIIHLGECEAKLKSHYNIDINESLLIFKIDLYNQGLSVPIIEYEIYNLKTKELLDLNICKDIKIDISIPVSINEDDLYKYNSSSDYYNDLCFTHTSEKGTDISLNDRKKEFVNNNLSLCEANCDYSGYDNYTKKSLCECPIKIKLPLISEIVINKDDLLNNFFDVKKSINVKVLKCYYKLFKKGGIIKNIGHYIILTIIICSIALIILFYFKGYNILKDKIKKKFLIRNQFAKKAINLNKTKIKKRKGLKKNKILLKKKCHNMMKILKKIILI